MGAGTTRWSADQIRRIAETSLERRIRGVERVPVGWSNENWRVATNDGAEFVVKVGPAEAAAKWAAIKVGYEHTAKAGVPAPRLVHLDTACALAGGDVVRILTGSTGTTPPTCSTGPNASSGSSPISALPSERYTPSCRRRSRPA